MNNMNKMPKRDAKSATKTTAPLRYQEEEL